MTAPLRSPGRAHWREFVPHRDAVKLESVDLFARHAVLTERADGLQRITVLQLSDAQSHVIDQPEAVYTASVGPNPEWETDRLRITYTSLVTPVSAVDYGMDSRERTIVKEQVVLGGYNPFDYVSRRLWAVADDGERVPISYVHRRDVALDGNAPALLYGYGSYEHSSDPTFSSQRLSLLDRGFVYAIAHVRGGGELGRRWYEDGKLLNKRNTFTDFCACADHLVAQHFTSHKRMAVRGASAGGLLMGAVTNLRPDVSAAVVAQVPFVDCLTTMLDPSLPLTVIEYEEWGNPEDAVTYEYMRGYSPYDNVARAVHPAILVTAGLNDPRVGYWEPAKWVARLREFDDGNAAIMLKTDLGAGHGGASGRYDAWLEQPADSASESYASSSGVLDRVRLIAPVGIQESEQMIERPVLEHQDHDMVNHPELICRHHAQPCSWSHGASCRPTAQLVAPAIAVNASAMMSGMAISPWSTSAAPITAPTSITTTAIRRRPARDPAPPASALSAANPVMVRVSTVVVRSGTASLRAPAFWIPIATASTTISV